MKNNRLIVAGCRDYHNYETIKIWLDKFFVAANIDDWCIVHGCASGVDSLADKYGKDNNIQRVGFPANWSDYGKAAGPRRNKQMAQYGTHLVAFWDGKSKGTLNMIETFKKTGKASVIIVEIP